MSDDQWRPTDGSEDPYDDRAATAFRSAFERKADDFTPTPVDTSAITATSARRTWWRAGLVAAAVLTLVSATAIGVSSLIDDERDPGAQQPSISSSGSTAPGDATENTPQTIDPSTAIDPGEPLPPPDPGWRYVSYRDVVVQVPEAWGYAEAPGPDWCAYDQGPGEPPFPTEPYVAAPDGNRVILAIGCPTDAAPGGARDFEAVPPEYWAPHLDFSDLGGRNWPGQSVLSGELAGSWTFTETRIGDVVLTLLTNPETAPLADQVIDSARQVTTDHNGCDARSAVQAREFAHPDPAFDVADLEAVDAISVCQYDRTASTRRPGLTGSRILTGRAALDELRAIQAAPIGGGPDTPESCADDMYGDTAVVLRLHEGQATYDMYVYYEWCFGNGFDDGTTMRELTTAACAPLFASPVGFNSGSSASIRRCHA